TPLVPAGEVSLWLGSMLAILGVIGDANRKQDGCPAPGRRPALNNATPVPLLARAALPSRSGRETTGPSPRVLSRRLVRPCIGYRWEQWRRRRPRRRGPTRTLSLLIRGPMSSAGRPSFRRFCGDRHATMPPGRGGRKAGPVASFRDYIDQCRVEPGT